MDEPLPLILEIKGNSLDDGPGIRTVVFFKGCPLSCAWCHNPESQKAAPELSFDAGACIGCHSCLEACPHGALSPDHALFVDRDRCERCFKCTAVCPANALEAVGKSMSVEAVVEQVLRDKPFFDASGGGVTLSGGEPTLAMDYLASCARALKAEGIHVLLETCGWFDRDAFMATVYPHLDQIYFDLKIMDSQSHKRHCGLPNARILENFTHLHRAAGDGGVPIFPRTPLVPGISDTVENLNALVDFYQGLGVTQTQLIPYHPLWQEKNMKIGRQPVLEGMDQWMSREETAACEAVFKAAGMDLVS